VQEARKHERENGEENSQNRELFHRTLVRERTLCPVDLSKEQTPLPDGGLLVSIRAHRNYLARNAESRLHPLRAGFAIDGTYGSDYRPIAREVRRSYRAKLKYACAALVLLLPAALMLAYILGGQSQMKENQVNASPLPDDIHDVVEKWLAIKQETVKSDGTLENISQATIDARLADRMGCSSQTLEAYIDFHSQSSNSLDRAYAALLKNDEEKATKALMSNMEQEMSVVRKLSIKAKLHAAANRYEDAIKDIHTILALLNEEKQPVLWAKAKYNLGYAYFLTGNFPMAKGSWEHALTMREQHLGQSHPDTLSCRHNLALILIEQGELGKAMGEFQGLVETSSKSLGHEHITSLKAQVALASLYEASNNRGRALEIYQAILPILTENYGDDHFLRDKVYKKVNSAGAPLNEA
ncbi:MAG: tetratricopeptide repeat protein, partial [Akkermansiaceae bacterium]